MKSLAVAHLAGLVLLAAACVQHAEPASESRSASVESTLVGQVLLPEGVGSRGVELVITLAEPGGASRTEWVLFDEDGRFDHLLQAQLTSVTLEVGGGTELHRFDLDRLDLDHLPEADPSGRIDVGVIDLRERLARHRVRLRAADGAPGGEVRVGMWFGRPPVGPYGEPVALGSRQFPPVALGEEVEWLLPEDAHSIHFLVERPVLPRRGTEWRSGHQRLFGPFSLGALPAELVMD